MPSFIRRQVSKPANASPSINWQVERTALRAYVEGLSAERRAELAVVFIRLSHLRHYILFAGIEEGNAMAQRVDRALRDFVGTADAVARETLVTFCAVVRQDHIENLADTLEDTLAQRGGAHGLVIKIGYCPLSVEGTTADLVEHARMACEDIRYADGVRLRLFDEKMRLSLEKRRYVTEQLDDAIARGEIRAYAQPIVRVINSRVCEVETLARWESERFGLITPDEFVPDLERLRLIHRLDAEIVRLACQQWHEASELGVDVPFGINLSRLDFELCDIYQVVRSAMETYDVPVEAVHIEVTESATTGREDLLRAGVQRFRAAGFQVYMDDFGTGYSSLEGLRDSDYDVVKIDMGLIRDIETNERSRVVVAEAVNMAKRLGMQTLCEGVETIEQLRFLRMIGCEKAQGFFFGRPSNHATAIKRLVEESQRYEEPGLKGYLDAIGHVNLIDGSRSNIQGIEAAVFLGDNPVAIVEMRGRRIIRLASNAAFDRFVSRVGSSSFEEMIGKISAGSGEMRTRMEMAARRAWETGARQSVDFVAGGFYSMVGIDFIARTDERAAFLITASSIDASAGLGRERHMEEAAPFLLSIYKRIDLFDLVSGTSENIYLSVPLLRSHRMQGIIHSEVREFCELNVHPDDQVRFLEFYDLATLGERVSQHGGHHDAALFRTRVAENRYEDHLYMLIPMVVHDRHMVLSTLRESDVSHRSAHEVSGSDTISDTTLLTAVLDGVDRNVFWKDRERRFLGANQAFLDYYGFKSMDEILGKTDEDVGWHVDNDPFRNDELRVLSGEVVNRARGACYARNELRAIEATKRPIEVDGRIVGLLGYFHDLGPVEDDERR